ncbi:hypothetical protein CHH55_15990 [Niallia circulans]|jgi:hypothetical protein|uniref:Uncharacterized protein n=1 Tax=Niallia circulans TaxID=1397 RepID=A0A0J1LFU3_NIACI|nr:hypothetical protein [Niallia circulans]KLV27985.1 hypothetical protein ABW02_03590 [Niallia circulans]MCM2982951.1 hypothetical protein [Niallia circulans]MED5102565.1 hypothetical protein [Niallia circulans]PAD24212.1 hypothetical protein CHH62_17090 [Niallia circulans]PAD86960.1 hypothetical protein CHH55_15990 [Niallia circulans]
MDQISCISYILHQSREENIRKIAIDLLIGDISLKEAERISPEVKKELKKAEALYKNQRIDLKAVSVFVQDFMFVTG